LDDWVQCRNLLEVFGVLDALPEGLGATASSDLPRPDKVLGGLLAGGAAGAMGPASSTAVAMGPASMATLFKRLSVLMASIKTRTEMGPAEGRDFYSFCRY